MGRSKDLSVQFGLVLDELRARRESQSRRLGAAETVSGVLVATAAVLVGLALGDREWSCWLLVPLVPALAAAGFGVFALWPRTIEELNPRVYRDEVLQREDCEAQLWMVDQQLFHVEARESLIRTRFVLVRRGLLCLIVAMVGVVLAMSAIAMEGTGNGKGQGQGPGRSEVAPAAPEG